MRIATFFIDMPQNTRKTVYLKHDEKETLGWLWCPASVSIKAEVYPTLWSEAKRGYMIDRKNRLLPIFGKSKRGVRIIIETDTNPAWDYAFAIFYTDEEIKEYVEKEIRLHVRPVDIYDEDLSIPGKKNIYTHKESRKIYLIGLLQQLGGLEDTRYKLYKNEDEIADYPYYPFIGLQMLNFLTIGTWIEKGESLTLEVIKAASESYARMHLVCALKEVDISEIPFLNKISPVRPIPPVDEDSDLIEISAPQPVLPPQAPTGYPPYPQTPDEVRNIFKPHPPIVDPDLSITQKSKETLGTVTVARDDETKVVQTMPSPYGGVRPTADPRGRQRTTNVDINYSSGKLEVTDTGSYTIASGLVSKKISIYAKAGNWQIKILTLYAQLSGLKIDDMPIIYVDEGQSFEEEIEAVQIDVTCTNASESVPGVLYYYIGE